jgi:hypothetical protein
MVLGLNMRFGACFWVEAHKGAFWRTRANKLEGRGWQEAYLFHFLAD